MRYLIVAISIVLCGCTSPAKNACKLIDASTAANIMGSKVTTMELDKGIDNGRVTSSSCMMNFEGGEFARVTVEEYSDLEYMHDMKDDFDKRNPRQEDADMTKTLGFPTFYESDREYLSADLAENKFLYINFDNYGSPQTKSLSVGNNGYVVRFNRPQVGSSREKIQKLAQAISF